MGQGANKEEEEDKEGDGGDEEGSTNRVLQASFVYEARGYSIVGLRT